MKAASPIVKLGKMMWNEIVNANWMRASRRASNSMGAAALACRRARILPPLRDASSKRERAHCHSSPENEKNDWRRPLFVASCASGAAQKRIMPLARPTPDAAHRAEGGRGRPAAMAA